jgi:hypothetical protein
MRQRTLPVSPHQKTAVTVAIAAGAAFILFLLGYAWKRHRFQRRWAALAARLGFAVYALLFSASAAALGWGFGTWSGWPDEHFAIRGVLWGSFGAAVLRAQFDRLPQPALAGEAVSAASAAGVLITNAVQGRVEEAIDEKIDGLSDKTLALYVLELLKTGPLGAKSKLSELDQQFFESQVIAANTAIDTGSAAEKRDARATLLTYGKQWAREYTFTPPRTRRRKRKP